MTRGRTPNEVDGGKFEDELVRSWVSNADAWTEAVRGGCLVIQTVHPAREDRPWQDGWREERFEPLALLEFSVMPWYFRRMASWSAELDRAGWRVVETREPGDPASGAIASLVLVAETAESG